MEVSLGQATWRKSSHSGGAQDCVEVADKVPGAVAVRDSKDPGGPALILSPAAWRSLGTQIKGGEFA